MVLYFQLLHHEFRTLIALIKTHLTTQELGPWTAVIPILHKSYTLCTLHCSIVVVFVFISSNWFCPWTSWWKKYWSCNVISIRWRLPRTVPSHADWVVRSMMHPSLFQVFCCNNQCWMLSVFFRHSIFIIAFSKFRANYPTLCKKTIINMCNKKPLDKEDSCRNLCQLNSRIRNGWIRMNIVISDLLHSRHWVNQLVNVIVRFTCLFQQPIITSLSQTISTNHTTSVGWVWSKPSPSLHHSVDAAWVSILLWHNSQMQSKISLSKT